MVVEEKVLAVKVNGIEDLGRMAASLVTMGQPTYILRFPLGEKTVFGILAVFRDYYKYYGLPMLYYYITTEPPSANYLIVKSDETGERVEFSKGPRPGWVTIPIVTLEQKPGFVPDELTE